MKTLDTLHAWPLWHLITRLGEAEIVLPVALLGALALALRPNRRRRALGWLLFIGISAAITTVSKVAFIGWGLGWATINFTGVSGHAMFATAIYPLLLRTLLGGNTQPRQRLALALGCALALLVGVSRVIVGAHAWSEVLAGWLLGAAATCAVLALVETEDFAWRPLWPFLPVMPIMSIAFVAWMSITLVHMRASQTHSLVTCLALKLSGHERPYTRTDLLLHLRTSRP